MEQFCNDKRPGHRVFVALPISNDLQHEAGEWSRKFLDLPVRWLKGKNLHITLVAPWYATDIEAVKAALAKVQGVELFAISLERISFGPSPRAPRLIWAEGAAPPEIIKLKQSIETALGFPIDRRPFRLHLTLARFRPEIFPSSLPKTLTEKINWPQTIDSFALMESHLASTGAEYEVLKLLDI